MRIPIKKLFLSSLIFASITAPIFADASSLKVVTSQAFYANLVREIGKDKVEVKSVASPKFNVHFIQPKPSDVRNVTRADLVMYTGMDLEEWWAPLVEAAGRPDFFPGRDKSADLSRGIRILKVPDHPLSRAEGDIHLFGNPHFIMNPENAKIMAGTILEKLKEVDPANAAFYEANEKAFVSRLDEKIAQWKTQGSHCSGQEIISYHDDIEYLADFLGLKDEQYLEPKPGVPPTPRQLEFLENYVKTRNIKAIVMPTYFPKDAAEALAKRVGAKVVTVCQNVGELPGTEDIFSFFDYDFNQISEALK